MCKCEYLPNTENCVRTVIIPREDEEDTVSENLKNDSKSSKCWNYLSKHVPIVTICALTLGIIVLITAIIILLKRDETRVTINILPENINIYGNFSSQSPLEDDHEKVPTHESLRPLPDQFKLVSRLEWSAHPPIKTPTPLAAPVPYVIIHYTATENCSSPAQCIVRVRSIQTSHLESRSWWDIGYNFLVGGDGAAYKGRGWTAEGAHTYGYNARSVGIAFIGTFDSFKPPHGQIAACKRLIAKGVALGYVREDYKLLVARPEKQLRTTQSAGAALYEELKTWEHWSPKP